MNKSHVVKTIIVASLCNNAFLRVIVAFSFNYAFLRAIVVFTNCIKLVVLFQKIRDLFRSLFY